MLNVPGNLTLSPLDLACHCSNSRANCSVLLATVLMVG